MIDQIPTLLKVVLVGDSGVGKTNIMSRYIKSQFILQSKTTIGVQFSNKMINVKGKYIKIQVWDTAGQQRYRSIVSSYYKGAQGVLLVYDITRQTSFESIDRWYKQIKNYGEQCMVAMLIGQSAVFLLQAQTAEDYANCNKMLFLQTSALDSTNIQQAFQVLVSHMLQNRERKIKLPQKQSTSYQIRPKSKSLPGNNKRCC